MSSQVVRIQGYSKGSLSAIGNECDRKPGVEHRNSDINVERSALNHSFKDVRGSFYSEHADIITALNAQYTEKKTGIAFEGMIITADSEFFENMGYDITKNTRPPKAVRDFFDKSYKWALEQIGYKGTDKNVISAKVHYDEKTPHLHIYYLPITDKWQDKVYAKDENGKVKRTEKGTPIQAKDENGKTIFKQVENSEKPKLSRTEFWRARGGKTSYRRMQDDFQEKIGKDYGLERGEVGSDREHESKYQYKERQLKESLKPYENMAVKINTVDDNAKSLLFGKTVVNTKAYERTKKQAKSYIVNRDKIRTLENDKATVEQEREQNKKERERNKRDREALSSEWQKVNVAYQRQLELNRILEQNERELQAEKEKTRSLTAENGALRAENAQRSKIIDELQKTNRGAYESLTNVCKAVGMLKYDKTGDYKADLTPQQARLIDGVANYSAKWAKDDGYPELAERIESEVGISKGIQKEMDKLNPKRNRGQSR